MANKKNNKASWETAMADVLEKALRFSYGAPEIIKWSLYSALGICALFNIPWLLWQGPFTAYTSWGLFCLISSVAMFLIVKWHARYVEWQWHGVWKRGLPTRCERCLRISLKVAVGVIVSALLLLPFVVAREGARPILNSAVFALLLLGNIVFLLFFLCGERVIVARG